MLPAKLHGLNRFLWQIQLSVIKSGTLINDSQAKIIHMKIREMIVIEYQPVSIVDHDDFKYLSVDS